MNFSTTNNTNYHVPYSELKSGVLKYYTYPLGVISIIFNLSVVISSGLILKSTVQPRSVYMILLNIAFADVMLAVVILLEIQFHAHREGLQCAILFGFIRWHFIECSLSLLLNAVDGYVYFNYGLYYSRWITTKRTFFMVLVTWLLSFLTGFIPELLLRKSSGNYCLYFSSTPFYVSIVTIITGLLPFIITIVLYSSISNIANKAKKSNIGMSEQNSSSVNSVGASRNSSINTDTTVDFRSSVNTEFGLENKFLNSKTINYDQRNKSTVFCISFKQINEHNSVATVRHLSGTNNDEINARKDHFVYKQSFKKDVKQKLITKSNLFVLLIYCTFSIAWGPYICCLLIHLTWCSVTPQYYICVVYERLLFFVLINFALLPLLLTPIIYWWWQTSFREASLKLCFKNAVREKRRRDIVMAFKR